MKGLRQEDLVNQDLITELRKEFSMTYEDFYMVLTDTDIRVKVRTCRLADKSFCFWPVANYYSKFHFWPSNLAPLSVTKKPPSIASP